MKIVKNQIFNKLQKKKEKESKKNIVEFFKDKMKNFKKFYRKKVKANKNTFTIKEVLPIMLITFLFGMLIGGVVMFGKGTFSSDVGDSLTEFVDTYEDILDNYYEELDAEELLQAGIEGMVDYLGDPYASYMSQEEAQKFNEKVEGEYVGIGAEISYSYVTGIVTISKIFEDGPAYKSDLKVGDILLEVDGESIEGLTSEQIASKVKGKKGTKVKIKVKREEEELEVELQRGTVDIESVISDTYEENGKKVAYLGITIFANNTYKQFKEKLEELEKDKFDSLLIDLRGNTGGYLTTVTDIISLFTKKGSVIYQLKTKDKIEKIVDKTKESRDYPIYVLTNGGSASASEVLTAAIKENYKGTILGEKTYGKGKVQKSYDLSNGSKIKYTFQEWLTPDGNSIDGNGVEPNISIEYKYDESGKDIQLEDAIKEIIK